MFLKEKSGGTQDGWGDEGIGEVKRHEPYAIDHYNKALGGKNDETTSSFFSTFSSTTHVHVIEIRTEVV